MSVRPVIAGSVLVLLCAAAPVRADIYIFTDDQGATHLTNVPADARYQVLLHSAPEVSQAGGRISARMLERSVQYDSIITTAAASTSVEAELLRAVIVVESGFDAAAVSPKGAMGLMQLMPATARAYGAADASDPAQNIHAGARYLRDLLNRYGDDLELVLAAYNAGEKAVERYQRQIPPFRETRMYVPRVLRIYRELQALPSAT
ncbi:MAG: lytic transglycosylase domain-containing protein [Gammaproteobacteria bacterium]|nr:lytic transglycosylase domain-containing protein [Gammaproteobacteria bacterium]